MAKSWQHGKISCYLAGNLAVGVAVQKVLVPSMRILAEERGLLPNATSQTAEVAMTPGEMPRNAVKIGKLEPTMLQGPVETSNLPLTQELTKDIEQKFQQYLKCFSQKGQTKNNAFNELSRAIDSAARSSFQNKCQHSFKALSTIIAAIRFS